MNSKLVSILSAIVVLVTLSSALPIDETETFLAKIDGNTCFSEQPFNITTYGCVRVCVQKNGAQVCYTKCTYEGQPQQVDTIIANVNGATCFSGEPTQLDGCAYFCLIVNGVKKCTWRCTYDTQPQLSEGISNYGGCVTVCVVKNGVRVCYQNCGYNTEPQPIQYSGDINTYGCLTICVVRNGVQVCYNKCSFDSQPQEMDTFLAQINGSTCVTGNNNIPANYGGCFKVCVTKNGALVCFTKCT